MEENLFQIYSTREELEKCTLSLLIDNKALNEKIKESDEIISKLVTSVRERDNEIAYLQNLNDNPRMISNLYRKERLEACKKNEELKEEIKIANENIVKLKLDVSELKKLVRRMKLFIPFWIRKRFKL